MADEVSYDDETFNEGPDAEHFEDHDDSACHFIDDFAYHDEERLPIPEKAPRMTDVIKVLERVVKDGNNPVIFRFALTYVDAETGHIQVVTNPRMSGPAGINLLTRAASIMAYQESQEEAEAEAVMAAGLGQAIKNAAAGRGPIPDLTAIFGHSGREMDDTEVPGNYL